jgi:predicted Zn-dependent protease
MMRNAFEQWQTGTYSAVWFTFLGENKKNEADITVHFVEKDTKCRNISAIGCTHSFVNQNGFFSHVDMYIASKAVQQLVGDDGTVATKTTLISESQLYRVMLHEIGHAIGINQHSNDPNSLMFKYSLTDVNIPQKLTDEDLKFVYNVYR